MKAAVVHLATTLRIALIGLAVCLAGACTCRGKDEGVPSLETSDKAGEPKRGGVLTMATHSVVTFDPIVGGPNVNTLRTVEHVFSRLVRTAKDGLSVEPELAEAWEISADGLGYTFHLRPNLKFSDGSPLRASDVRFSLMRAAQDPRSEQKALFPTDFAIETPDDRTVVLKLKSPHASLLAVLAVVGACVVPEEYFKRVGPEKFAQGPIGSGAFVVAEWKRGDRTVLRRNPHYWDAPRPYLDEIRLLDMPDELTRQLKLQAGEIDMIDEVYPQQVASLRSTPGIRLHKALGFVSQYLSLNPRRPELQARKVRQAISLAIDRSQIIRIAFSGHGEPSTSYLPGLLYSSKEPFEHDVEKAKRLLSESGHPNGLTLRLVIGSFPPAVSTAIVLQQQLELAGIRIDLSQLQYPELTARIKADEYELSIDGSLADSFDPVEYTMYNLTNAGYAGGRYGYKNDEIDALALKAEAENEPVQRAADYRKLEQLAIDVGPHIPLVIRMFISATRENVHDVTMLRTSESHRLWEIWKSP